MSPEWTSTDAWVFAAIVGSGAHDGCTLAQIIAHADHLNHAILTEAEFTRAVPRLVGAGLIGAQMEIDRYWRTEAGNGLDANRIKAIPPALRRLGAPRDGEWNLLRGTFDRAIEEYLGQAGSGRGTPR